MQTRYPALATRAPLVYVRDVCALSMCACMCAVYVRLSWGVCAPSMCVCMCAPALGEAGRSRSLSVHNDHVLGHRCSCHAIRAAHAHSSQAQQSAQSVHIQTCTRTYLRLRLREERQLPPHPRTCTHGQRTATRTYRAHTHSRAHILSSYSEYCHHWSAAPPRKL